MFVPASSRSRVVFLVVWQFVWCQVCCPHAPLLCLLGLQAQLFRNVSRSSWHQLTAYVQGSYSCSRSAKAWSTEEQPTTASRTSLFLQFKLLGSAGVSPSGAGLVFVELMSRDLQRSLFRRTLLMLSL